VRVYRQPANMVQCEVCARSFAEPRQLKQHIIDSLEHSPEHLALCCLRCNTRPFTSSLAKQQHTSDSHAGVDVAIPNGAPLNTAPTHNPAPGPSPLGEFFESYPTFQYNPDLAPSTSLRNLIRHLGRGNDGYDAMEARARYHEAFRAEVATRFGNGSSLETWHKVCHAVGIFNPPASITKCKQAS
jgi:hypothetical protein